MWECDTRLDGLIKQSKDEESLEGLDLTSDELENKSNGQLAESTSKMEITRESEEKKVTITYRKKSK